MSTISNVTISALLALLAGLGIGGNGTSQLAAISGVGSGLVAHYTFDEGSGTTAGDSAGSNTGTLTNGPTWTTGKIGSGALSFNGSNTQVTTGVHLFDSYPATACAWVRPQAKGDNSHIIALDNRALYLEAFETDGADEFVLYNDNGGISTPYANRYPIGSWNHVCGTVDISNNASVYVNGTLVVGPININTPPGFRNFVIGSSYSNGGFFSGSIDEVRVYNRVLSASEIQEVYAYTGGSTPTPTNGVCGSSNNICSSGTLSDQSDSSSQYLWQCLGLNGGTTASCSATIPSTPVNGVCGSSNNVCTSGVLNDTADTASLYQWQCTGVNGGSTATCSQSIPVSTYTLSITKSGTGSGTVTGGSSISCGSTCSQSSISGGTSITLTATPTTGSTFTGWSGGGCSGTGTCTTTVTGNTTITASFSANVTGSCSLSNIRCVDDTSGSTQEYSTITTCSNAAMPGDTCLIYPGRYDERVVPARSGSSGNVITFKGAGGGASIVRGFSLISKSYIVIDGLEITSQGMTPQTYEPFLIEMNGTNNSQIINNNLHNPYASGFIDERGVVSNDNVFRNNTLAYCSSPASWAACIGISIYGHRNIIEGNDISHLGDDFTRVLGGDKNVIRNNIFHDNVQDDWAGNATAQVPRHIDGMQNWCGATGDLVTRYTLVENNQMYNAPSPDSHFIIYQDYGLCGNSDFLVRYNSVYNIGDGVQINDEKTSKVRLYNNSFSKVTIAHSPAPWDGLGYVDSSPYGKIINNIFHDLVRDGGTLYAVDSSSLTGFDAHNNLAYNTGYNGSWPGMAGTEVGIVKNQNPLFTSSSNLSLQSSSPAIDRGGYLTKVAVADTSSGTTLVVDDAGFFQDGWAGVSTDWIAVGNVNNISQISSINYSNNTITLTSSLSRNDNDPVWLSKNSNGSQVLYSSAPDIGAYEFTGGSSSAINGSCSATVNQCDIGSFSDVTDSSTLYQWQCLGLNGGTTASCSQTIPVADTTLPMVSISSPTNSSTVSGSSVSLVAIASDNIGVIGVQFQLDGTNLSSELTTAPYSGTWNTTGVSNGTHTLTAVARDLAGNTKVSTTVTITVSNVTPTTPTTGGGGTGGGSSSSGSSSSSGGSSSSSSVSTPSTGTLTPTVPQKPAVTTTTCKATTQLGQLVELFISLGIIKQDKVPQARSYICSLSSTTPTGTKFTLALDIGARNSEVTALQTYLISQGLLQTKATGYFGPATAKAVGLFQQKYDISTLGSPSYGFVGPKTRAKLNELVK